MVKNEKRMAGYALIAVIAVALLGVWWWKLGKPMLLPDHAGGGSQERTVKIAERVMEIDFGDGIVLEYENTHGGFHGDGETYLTMTLEQAPEGWEPLPLAAEPEQAAGFAGDYFDGIDEGCWWFLDRQGGKAGKPYSWNFSLAVYDSARKVLRYYELDT